MIGNGRSIHYLAGRFGVSVPVIRKIRDERHPYTWGYVNGGTPKSKPPAIESPEPEQTSP